MQVDAGLAAVVEDVISSGVQVALETITAAIDQFGPRPLGYVKGDRWSELEQFCDLSDDPAGWLPVIQDWAQMMGEPAAWALAEKEDTRLNLALARTGGWQGTPEQLLWASYDAQAFAPDSDGYALANELIRTFQLCRQMGVARVRSRQLERRFTKAERASKAADKILGMPPAIIAWPAPVYTDEQLLGLGDGTMSADDVLPTGAPPTYQIEPPQPLPRLSARLPRLVPKGIHAAA